MSILAIFLRPILAQTSLDHLGVDVHETRNALQRDDTTMPITPADQKPKIGFVHIPKCGGTSLEMALGIAKSYPDLGIKKTKTDADKSVIFGGGLQHLTVRKLRRNYAAQWNGLDESFTVVRDPLDRLVSHLFWRISRFEALDEDEEEVIRRLEKLVKTIETSAQGNHLFQDPMIGNEYDHTDLSTLSPSEIAQRHLLPQCAFLFDKGSVGVDRIYMLDRMNALESHLQSVGRLSAPIEKRMSRGSHFDFASKIPEHLKTRIRDIYRHDFEMVDIIRRNSENSDEGYCSGQALQKAMQPAQPPKTKSSVSDKSVPRKLFLYWHQGWETAPQLVQYCRDSWAQLNPGWELHLLTKDNLHEYVTLPQYYQDDETFSLAALSDVIRVHLLAAHGGVWADATTFCTRPLDEWIDRCTSDAGIFAYAKPRPTSPIASWFLAAHHDSEIMKVYCNAVDNLWQQFTAGHSYDVQLALFTAPNPVKMAVLEGTFSKQRIWLLGRKIAGLRDAVFKDKKDKTPSNPFNRYYFWFHQVFQVLRICHPTVSTLWDKAPEVTADGPHFVQKNGMCTPITPELDFHITNRMSNMYKLNRREELPDDLNGTAVGLLIDMHLGQPQDT